MEKNQPITSPELTPERGEAQIKAEIEKLKEFIERRTKANEREVALYGPKKYPDPDLSDAQRKLSELFEELKEKEKK